MTSLELNQKMSELVKTERKITNEILNLINIADFRRLHLEMGFASLFDWLVRGHGYSEAAAHRRVQAARLLRTVPDVAEKLVTGQTNLTNLAKVQSTIQAQEKLAGSKMTFEAKADVINKIESKITVETERTLLALFPETASSVHLERKTQIDENVSRWSFNFDNETVQDLERAKEVLSHALPGANLAAVIKYMTRDFLKRRDSLRQIKYKQSTSVTENRCVI